MKCCLPITLILLVPFLSTAQGEFMNWHFGSGAAITFNNGAPQKTTSAVNGTEGVASISDAAGNLLFYTNGQTVWDKTHQVMQNGDGLDGGLSSVQGAVIVPMPGNDQKYYLFTVGASGTAGNLYYNIIDMAGNGGKGMIESGSKNVFMTSSMSEKMTYVRSASCDFWLITHMKNTNMYEARRITASGIDGPIQTIIGAMHIDIGCIKASPDNKKIVATNVSGMIELLDFDNSTGVFANPIALPYTTNNLTYTACFSPDNSKVYVNEGGYRNTMDFFQFDLSDPTPAAIIASRMHVGTITTGSSLSLADLQIAPDGKVYFSRVGTSCLGAILFPNEKAPLCGITDNAICNIGGVSLGLPSYVHSRSGLMNFSIGADTTLCPGSTLQLSVADTLTALWSTGAVTTTININTDGKYWVRVGNGQCVGSDTINVSFNGKPVNLGKDTAICTGSSLTLQLEQYTDITWSDMSNGNAFTITSPGKYWVQAKDDCGLTSSDTILVTEKNPVISLGADQQLCKGTAITLQAPAGFSSYAWGPNYYIDQQAGSSVRVNPPIDTAYHVKATTANGCMAYDTIRIKVVDAKQVMLPIDTVICEGKSIRLNAGNFAAYTWHDGSTLSYIMIDTPVMAWVKTTDNNGCITSDTVHITWKDCGTGVWIPTAFTPNNDMKNDEFRVMYQGIIEQFTLSVYSRNGMLLFRTNDPDKGWDGKISNVMAGTQVFIWTCDYKLKNRAAKNEKGTVTLIR